MPTPDLTPELRQLADHAADRALAALRAALAPRVGPRRASQASLEGRLARHLEDLPVSLRTRLGAKRVARTPEPPVAKIRPAFRWPSRLLGDVAPPPTATALDLRLLSLQCIDDTREAGNDEMSLGLIQVVLDHGDPVTQATEVLGPFALGEFRTGVSRTFSPPQTLTTVTPGGAPRTVTTVLVLADIDFGGLAGLLAAMASGVTDELILELAQRMLAGTGAAIGATFFGTLGTIFGPVGTAGGITLGIALGAAVGYAVGKALEGLLQMFKDDPLTPLDWTISVVTNPGSGLVGARQLAFSGQGAAYTASLEWRAR